MHKLIFLLFTTDTVKGKWESERKKKQFQHICRLSISVLSSRGWIVIAGSHGTLLLVARRQNNTTQVNRMDITCTGRTVSPVGPLGVIALLLLLLLVARSLSGLCPGVRISKRVIVFRSTSVASCTTRRTTTISRASCKGGHLLGRDSGSALLSSCHIRLVFCLAVSVGRWSCIGVALLLTIP